LQIYYSRNDSFVARFSR